MLKSFGMDPTGQSDEEIFKEHTEIKTEKEFDAYRNELINKFIENPCIPLAKKLMDSGYQTTWSNGYGSGPKGVFWFNPDNPDKSFFTSLLNGHTYAAEVHNQSKRPHITSNKPVEQKEPNVIEALPEGHDVNAPL